MGKIICSSCRKNTPSNGKVCIFCGYPVEKASYVDSQINTQCKIYGKTYNLSQEIEKALSYEGIGPERHQLNLRLVRRIQGLSYPGAEFLTSIMRSSGEVPPVFDSDGFFKELPQKPKTDNIILPRRHESVEELERKEDRKLIFWAAILRFLSKK